MAGLDDLVGSSYGPFDVAATESRVDAFAAVIGDSGRWTSLAPPMFANAVLFAAAPAFLEAPEVVPFTRSLIHSEQTYEWSGSLHVGETVAVTGTVESVRGRGALNLVTFATEAGTPAGTWLRGSSVFLMSDQPAAGGADWGEPAEDERPPFDALLDIAPLPPVGDSIGEVRCGASRSDLADYAAASGDGNPIHLEHDAARSAGLGGVIVHGLLMGAWMARAAERYGRLTGIRMRFRSPLRPAIPALVTGTVTAADPATIDLLLSTGADRLVSGRASVTP